MRTLRPFRIARGTTTDFENLLFQVDLGADTGWGEACPGAKVTGETLDAAAAALAAWAAHPVELEALAEATEWLPGGHATPAARSAAVCALVDAVGSSKGIPARKMLNLPAGSIDSSITLSMGTPEEVLAEAAARAPEGWRAFKVKLGGPDDDAVVHALRDRYPDVRLRVDANEAWSPQVAEQRLAYLERKEVEFVEQPLPRGEIEATAALARRFEIPIILDEALRTTDDALELIGMDAADGANVKLAKCGGPYEARRIIKILRDHGWRTMVGCNLESTVGNAAAALFAGSVDYADVDSHLLIAEDPFEGIPMERGRLEAPDAPGLGIHPKPGLGGRIHPIRGAGPSSAL